MAETWTVCHSGCDFTTIQAAINTASDGDVILVQSGSYNEVLDINRSVILTGVDTGGGLPNVGQYTMPIAVTISAPNVTFQDFWVHGAGVHALALDADHLKVKGIFFSIHRPTDIESPIIVGEGLTDIEVSNCMMESTGVKGIDLQDCSQLLIANNLIIVNSETGDGSNIIISFTSADTPYSSIRVINNTLENGGMSVASATSGSITYPEVHDILIHGNVISESPGHGIFVGGFMSLSGEYHFFNVTVAGNTMTGSSSAASNIELNAISGGIVRDNLVKESYHGADGITIGSLDGFIIQDNSVQDCTVNPEWGTQGFYLATTTNSVVSGNTITNVEPFAFGYAPGPNFHPNLTFDETNTADGKPVLFYEDENGVTIDGRELAMVVLLSCEDITIRNSAIENTGLGVGIYNCTGTTVSGNELLNTNHGIMLIASSDSAITDNTFRGSFFGLGVGDNRNALITGNKFSEYMDSGIVVHTGDSENVQIIHNTFTGTMSGLDQAIVTSDANCAGITIAQNTMEHNSRGMLIYFTVNAVCLNNTMKNNGIGINLNAAQDNVFCNNTIINDDEDYVGVYLFHNITTGGGLVLDNQFTNNYIDSETPLFINYGDNSDPDEPREYGPLWGPEIVVGGIIAPGEGHDAINIWNTTKIYGTNIVSGPYLGGNYWAKPDGTGWSQITPDRGDGFCNAPFVYDANNTDYLPLHIFDGEIPITAPAVIDQPGRYRLMDDLFNSTAEYAIWIKASDVFLNGDGHTVGGSGAWETCGVFIGGDEGDYSNITIRNLTTTGWMFGFSAEAISGSVIHDCVATGNLQGIALGGSSDIIIEACRLNDNVAWEENGTPLGGTGMTLTNSPGTRILNSTISDNGWGEYSPFIGGYGVWMAYSPGTLLSGCTISHNINTGIWNEKSMDVMVRGCEIHDNSGNGGIFMTAPAGDPELNCTIEGNLITGGGWGIWLMRDTFLVRDNSVTGCGYGILLDNAQNATLSGNAISDNDMNFGVDGSDVEDYYHQVDTTNTVDGRPVYYLVEETGAVVDGTTGAGTVFGIACPNLTVQDLMLQKNGNGVTLVGSDHAVIQNVTVIRNNIGLLVRESDHTVIETCSATDNILNGFRIQDSERVRITESEALSSSDPNAGSGIGVQNCHGIILHQVTASQNTFAGIDLEDTEEAYFANVTVDSNGAAGIILSGESIYVIGSTIQNNDGPGIGILDLTNFTIWNNYFSNDVNIDLSQGVVSGSYWNAVKTAGTNIVNGPFIGGNYWANPDGTGWSQVTPDRGDGFCNAPLVIDEDNTDYLPLHIRTEPPFYADFTATPRSGDKPLTVRFTDESDGNVFMYLYRFGDGFLSTSKNPMHTYQKPGNYTVSLTIRTMDGRTLATKTMTKEGYIRVEGAPGPDIRADFTAVPTTGSVPLQVLFRGSSSGTPIMWKYDFGDGFLAASQNPTHTYRKPGTYTVTLKVWAFGPDNKLLTNSTQHVNYITVS